MGNLKIKIGGWVRSGIYVDFETHLVNGSLNYLFSGMIEGFAIDTFKFDYIGAALLFEKSGVQINVGDEITMSDINNNLVLVTYDHQYNEGGVDLTATGPVAKYHVILTFANV